MLNVLMLFLTSAISYAEDYNKNFYFDDSFNFNYKYHHTLFWTDVPAVYVCDNAEIGFTALNTAINFWEKKGYYFNLVENKINCDNVSEKRGIFIVNNTGMDIIGKFGETVNFVYPDNKKLIYRTEIKINNKNNSHNHPEIIIHEIGHALGIEHHSSKDSVMFEKHFTNYSYF